MPEHGESGGFQIFNPGSPTERRRAPTHTMGTCTVDPSPAGRAGGARVSFELHVV
jgi:predicted phosphodiesterase